MMGETNPFESLPGTIRGDYCIEIGRNVIHGSDSVEAAWVVGWISTRLHEVPDKPRPGWRQSLLVLGLVEDVGQTALAAVLAVEVGSHEDAGAALLGGALAAEAGDLAVVVNLVVLEDGELDLPVLVLDLLGGGVVLLLALLGTSPQPEDEVEGGLLLDVVVGEGPAVLQLLAGEDQPLLVRGDALLVLDLGLDILDGVRGLHLQGDGLPRECLHEDLHGADRPTLL